jgi:hypothetical protein
MFVDFVNSVVSTGLARLASISIGHLDYHMVRPPLLCTAATHFHVACAAVCPDIHCSVLASVWVCVAVWSCAGRAG